jgi:hypothetical protein
MRERADRAILVLPSRARDSRDAVLRLDGLFVDGDGFQPAGLLVVLERVGLHRIEDGLAAKVPGEVDKVRGLLHDWAAGLALGPPELAADLGVGADVCRGVRQRRDKLRDLHRATVATTVKLFSSMICFMRWTTLR